MKSQKITPNNYFDTIKKIGFENLPLVLKQSHTVILTKTVNGEDWSKYKSDTDLKRMIDLVFKKVEEFLKSKDNPNTDKKKKSVDGTPHAKKYKTELQFIQRYLNLHNTIKSKSELNQFIDELQACIKSRKIKQTSIVAEEILYIQSSLLSKINHGGSKIPLKLKDSTITKMQDAIQLIEEQNIQKETNYKQNDNLNGVEENENTEPKKETANKTNIMSSADFANMQFNTIGLKDKWFNLIGDPAPGFTAMVYGRPKMGKSYLCVDFANYLATNHGRVLYVSKEEFMSPTFAIKLKDKEATSTNMDISGSLPNDLSPYQFVFIDSVTSLKLTPDDLLQLKARFPQTSFIYVFQVSKNGSARGTNEYMHNVDIVIEVPEKGIAVQNGRFNQGGEMNIFDASTNREVNLSGTGKVKKKSKPEPIMEIETEFSIPLEELAMELISPKKPQEEIVNLLDDHPEKANKVVRKLIVDFISDQELNIKVTKVKFNQMDSVRLTHGVAYFDASLKGTKTELKKIADNDLLFNYDWENYSVEGVSKDKNIMRIKPTYSAPLQEFDFLIERGESVQEAIRANKSEAERWVKKLVEDQIKKTEADVKVEDVYFMSSDDEEDVEGEEGFSYYDLRISGSENELRRVAGKDKDLYYEWKDKENISGIKSSNSKHNLTLRNNVPLLDGTKNKAMKKATKKNDWTEPEWLNQSDWNNLKIIKKYFDKGDFISAMNHAMNCDTVIREEIPPDVWKKMGGQLTKIGEEKLKAMKDKSPTKTVEQVKKRTIVFNHGVRVLKGVIEREWDLELTDADYIEILDIAQETNSNLPEIVDAIHNNLSDFLTVMKRALEVWDKKVGKSVEKSRDKFYPELYANRKDDENPGFIFSLTNTKILTEALQGDFDLVYLVRRELATRGLDSKGKWVGFQKAEEIHRV